MIEPATSLLRPQGPPGGGPSKTWPRARAQHGLGASIALLVLAGTLAVPGLARAERSALKPDPPPQSAGLAGQVAPDSEGSAKAADTVAAPPPSPVSSSVRGSSTGGTTRVDAAKTTARQSARKRPAPTKKAYQELTPERRYGFEPDLTASMGARTTHVLAALRPGGPAKDSRDTTPLLLGVLVLSLLVGASGNLLRLLARRPHRAQTS
jgi:hypothetical protein